MGAVVAAEDDDGVVAESEPVDGGQDLADLVVDPGHEAVVAGVGGEDLLGGEAAGRDPAGGAASFEVGPDANRARDDIAGASGGSIGPLYRPAAGPSAVDGEP